MGSIATLVACRICPTRSEISTKTAALFFSWKRSIVPIRSSKLAYIVARLEAEGEIQSVVGDARFDRDTGLSRLGVEPTD